MPKEHADPLQGRELLNMDHIGPNIRRLRNLHDLKQEDLAKKLGISRQMLHHYENNKYRVPKPVLKIITGFFEVDLPTLQLPSIAIIMKTVN